MTRDETEEIVRRISGTWMRELNTDEATMWAETLAPLLPAHARTAVRALRDTTEFIPSHAAFLDAYRIAERRAVDAQAAVPPAHGRPSDEQRARNVARVRELKASLKSGVIGRRLPDLDEEF